jgi:nucleoside-diphosphate-sugar epimerase
MSAPLHLVVTGATGFLGARTVAAALARGHRVTAVARRDAADAPMEWDGAQGLARVAADLATEAGAAALDDVIADACAVIHAAARLSGDDAEHARDTVAPTERLLAALARRAGTGHAPRLILVSSFSVYGYAALPDGAQLDETTPLEPDPETRDAYTRAKLAQERAAMAAVQRSGIAVRALRPGVIYGEGKLWTPRLGVPLGPLFLRVGRATVPGISVEACAAALVRAAETPMGPSDIPLPPGPLPPGIAQRGEAQGSDGRGGFEAINLVEPDPPDAAAWLAVLRRSGWPKRVIPLPWGLASKAAKALGLALVFAPGLSRRLPGLMRVEPLAARFKPLRYSDARFRDRLGGAEGPRFAERHARPPPEKG